MRLRERSSVVSDGHAAADSAGGTASIALPCRSSVASARADATFTDSGHARAPTSAAAKAPRAGMPASSAGASSDADAPSAALPLTFRATTAVRLAKAASSMAVRPKRERSRCVPVKPAHELSTPPSTSQPVGGAVAAAVATTAAAAAAAHTTTASGAPPPQLPRDLVVTARMTQGTARRTPRATPIPEQTAASRKASLAT
mmetsp:Transcript_19864/g.70290  ORF Transcript_19864/g.70290 Transcript_19864/m.70290 type:complete len:201 (-) Transcript_19864:164-766(-)